MIPLTLTRFIIPNALKHPHSITLPAPCFTLEMVFFGLSICPFFKHRQHLYGQRALLLFHLTKRHVSRMHSFSPGCPLNFSLAWKCLLFRRGDFHGRQPHSPFLSRPLVSVFIEISIQDLIKSFTSVLAVVLGSLEITVSSFLFKVFEIFLPVLHCVGLFKFLIILLTSVHDTQML